MIANAAFIATFLASAVEAIELVTIVIGVGATRGWRSTVIGALSGFGVLAVIVVVVGAALTAIPIGPLRLVVGTLLLVFGLQWFRKGIVRVAARGFAGAQGPDVHDGELWTEPGLDWTAFVLAFKGVLLEGLEVAFIVVSFGASANQYGVAAIGGIAAVVVVGAVGFAIKNSVTRIPRSLLQLVVGIMLTTFGSFWALEGLGVRWPLGDGSIPVLLSFYAATGLGYVLVERRRLVALRAAAPA
ncbi:MAG TPA: hypothetical protein VKT20_12650 [Candidatus Dormibacteraeota bacterium]|nr:hypothetical protein [Candidatus Dormibacteraeota bacterium]